MPEVGDRALGRRQHPLAAGVLPAGSARGQRQVAFINREARPRVAVREIHLKGRLSAAGGAVSLTSGQGVYRTIKVVSECEVEIGVDAAKMLRDPSEHQDESFFGDF